MGLEADAARRRSRVRDLRSLGHVAGRDRRYSTAAWQRLRRVVLARDAYTCQIRGPRCEIHATTAHHIKPSSQFPELFWDPANLEASCKPCNDHGGAVRNENRVNRREIQTLEQLVEDLEEKIVELTSRLDAYENPPARPKRTPAIH